MISDVVYLALASRLAVFLLQVIFNWTVPDHDAGSFRRPTEPASPGVVGALLGGFARWDAQYFLHIAEHGYTYENTLAFFPLYPQLVRCVAETLLDPLPCCLPNALLLSGVLVNAFAFVVAAVSLYRLTALLFDEATAVEAALLFCFNPASVFFSACYTESLFAAITFLGLFLLESGRETLATVCFVLGGFVRSNGFLTAGFLVFHALIKWSQPWRSGCEIVCATAVRVAVCFAPFLLFQCYAWSLFCIPSVALSDAVVRHAEEKGYRLAGRNMSEWCGNTLPFSYGYVQQTYWGVGFLNYYQLKQLPNFLLAAPMVAYVGLVCYRFLGKGYRAFFPIRWKAGVGVQADVRRLPYVIHACAFLLLCVLFANVQVTTRLIAASSPVPYWATVLLSAPVQSDAHKGDWRTKLDALWRSDALRRRTLTYFASYFVLGTALHVNSLPWT